MLFSGVTFITALLDINIFMVAVSLLVFLFYVRIYMRTPSAEIKPAKIE